MIYNSCLVLVNETEMQSLASIAENVILQQQHFQRNIFFYVQSITKAKIQMFFSFLPASFTRSSLSRY